MASPDFLRELMYHPFYKRLFSSTPEQFTVDYNRISEAIPDNSLCGYTDGPYNPQESTGAHGWVIASHTTELWRGTGPSDGHTKLMSLYRAELGRIVVGLRIIHTICQVNQINQKQIWYKKLRNY
jgi:hypothetical protein